MRVIIAAAALAIALGACAAKEKQWVKDGAGPNTIRSDKYWCARYDVEKYEEANSRNAGVRKSRQVVSAECMRKRGYRYE